VTSSTAPRTIPIEDLVVKLDPASARVRRTAALAIMIVPAVGFAGALYQLFAGHVTTTAWVLFGVMYALHMGGISIGFHRYLAHKSFKTSTVFEGILLVCGSMAGQGPIMDWITTHRRHHVYSDREGDPHSPNLHGSGWGDRLRGLWHAHMPWMLSDETSKWSVFAPDVLSNRRLFFYHRTYLWWVGTGLAVPTLVGLAIDGGVTGALNGFLFGGLARMFLVNQASWCVGSVAHMFGRRPFRTDDNSANNWTVAVLTFGEGLQNNHHAFPSSYRLWMSRWEPDLGGWLLALFHKLRLVDDLREPSPEAIARRRKTTDAS
jgi:stearoyl-CoA desaturase (Delta-9 desaturase)